MIPDVLRLSCVPIPEVEPPMVPEEKEDVVPEPEVDEQLPTQRDVSLRADLSDLGLHAARLLI